MYVEHVYTVGMWAMYCGCFVYLSGTGGLYRKGVSKQVVGGSTVVHYTVCWYIPSINQIWYSSGQRDRQLKRSRVDSGTKAKYVLQK
jgi:hypothetical protein